MDPFTGPRPEDLGLFGNCKLTDNMEGRGRSIEIGTKLTVRRSRLVFPVTSPTGLRTWRVCFVDSCGHQ